MRKKIILKMGLAGVLLFLFSCNNSGVDTPSLMSYERVEKNPVSKSKKGKYLNLISQDVTGIDFQNKVNESNRFNHQRYPQIYNGSGVAIGDLNGDGLVDIYFGGNSVNDRLYFNKGNFEFEDVTKSSGIFDYSDGWTFGVNFVDINNDEWLDIYVCKAGDGSSNSTLKNKLFVNNKDGSFTEKALDYNLDINSYSVQSAFFDYDLDGDLDLYLLNHPIPGSDSQRPSSFKQYVDDIKSGVLRTDQFFENVGGTYIDKTEASNLVNYGYKNAVAIGDFDNNGYPDLYISTDYGEPDLYYTNNGDKTFTNSIDKSFKHITYYSMGSDASDINNDGLLDLFITDMTPSDHVRSKRFMASMNAAKFNAFVHYGFHHQYMTNTLQINNGNKTFKEIGQLAGISKTDWSWSPLFFDVNLDGNKDLFVTNGIVENLNDNDIKVKVKAQENELNRVLSLEEYLEIVPSDVISNQLYQGKGEFKFQDVSKDWIDNTSFNSNGAVYADLDNDGDYDIITNNSNSVASVYENSGSKANSGNVIGFKIVGNTNNSQGLGTKIKINVKDKTYYYEHYPSKGYLSHVDPSPLIGVDTLKTIPKIQIIWPDNTISHLTDINVNQKILIDYNKLDKIEPSRNEVKTNLTATQPSVIGLDFKHKEDKIDDFKNQILLPYSQSQNGPCITKGDVNDDGLEDIFIGGASGQKSHLYLQKENDIFELDDSQIWKEDSIYEDQGAVFFDADNDGDLDLYVTSGGAAFPHNSSLYMDRFYENNGSGSFRRNQSKIPQINTSTQIVKTSDIDNDGDLDLFVGGRVIPDKYPYSPMSYLLLNNNGNFEDITDKHASEMRKSGLVTGALFSDYDNDGDEDLIVTGEWTEIQFYENDKGRFTSKTFKDIENSRGLWFSSKAIDLDNDGDDDYLFGNLGINSKYVSKNGKAFHVFCDDFDDNGTYDIYFSKDYNGQLVPMRGRECSSQQMPFILEKFDTYESFATADVADILGEDKLQNALHYEVKDFKSIALINKGNGSFEKIELPIETQVSPVMDFISLDIDNDSKDEIIGVGNLYPTEVETTRFDASQGFVLKFENDKFIYVPSLISGLAIPKDTRDIEFINISDNKKIIIAGNNDDLLSIFKLD